MLRSIKSKHVDLVIRKKLVWQMVARQPARWALQPTDYNPLPLSYAVSRHLTLEV